jgi:hypothetical protein
MATFQKDITFLSKTPDSFNQETGKWEPKEIIKTATFKELDPNDKEQHKLHFKIVSIFENFGEKEIGDDGNPKVTINSDGIYDLTVKAIKTLLLPDENFTVQDKSEFLNDSGALFDFAFWLLPEKITPFFSKFKRN